MPKTDSITSEGWEVRQRSSDWRMRSPSDEGGDNTTPPERGPLGPGGIRNAGGLRPQRRMTRSVGMIPKAGVNASCIAGMRWIGLKRKTRWRKTSDRTARCLVLEAVLGKTQRTEF